MTKNFYTEEDMKQLSDLMESIIKRHADQLEHLLDKIEEQDKKIKQYERLLRLVKMAITEKNLNEELCEEIIEEKL